MRCFNFLPWIPPNHRPEPRILSQINPFFSKLLLARVSYQSNRNKSRIYPKDPDLTCVNSSLSNLPQARKINCSHRLETSFFLYLIYLILMHKEYLGEKEEDSPIFLELSWSPSDNTATLVKLVNKQRTNELNMKTHKSPRTALYGVAQNPCWHCVLWGPELSISIRLQRSRAEKSASGIGHRQGRRQGDVFRGRQQWPHYGTERLGYIEMLWRWVLIVSLTGSRIF